MSHVRDETNRVFGERIASEVERLRVTGLSKRQIAEDVLGISRSALDRYEKGTPPREISRLASLADKFGVTMDYLWGAADERTATRSVADPSVVDALALLDAARAALQAGPTAAGAAPGGAEGGGPRAAGDLADALEGADRRGSARRGLRGGDQGGAGVQAG